MNSLRLIEIGDALGLPLPAAMLARLGLKDGDTIYLKETTDGFVLSKDPEDGVAAEHPKKL